VSRCSGMFVVACVLLTSCGASREASRVAMQKDQTSITFGFTPVKARPTQRAPGKAAFGEVQEPADQPVPTSTFSPIFRTSPDVASGPCPTARAGDPVTSHSTTEVKGRPEPGLYRWLGAGGYRVSTTTVPMPAYFAKYVLRSRSFEDDFPRSAGQPAGDNFTYATLEPSRQSDALLRIEWQTKTFPGSAQDPEGGLVVKAVESAGPDGKTQSTYFRPQTDGLLFAPFPIKAGGTWTSTSVDISNGQRVMQLSGQVLKREVVDACGTLVEGWRVHATLTQSGESATLDYLVASQLGGMVVALNIDGFFFGTTYENSKSRFGQLKPKPLPKGVE
jgi:hypothetical protein